MGKGDANEIAREEGIDECVAAATLVRPPREEAQGE